MSFQKILRHFLQANPSAIGAVFVDREGESVDFWTERVFDIGHDGLRAIGAYQSIYVAQLERICRKVSAGAAERLVIDFEHATVITWHLKDEYYLVVIADHNANEETLLKRLRTCRDRIAQEL